jgi:asparagine synthase (glutamine-hydrolysing)
MRAIAGLWRPGAAIAPESCSTMLRALTAGPASIRQAAAGVVLGASEYCPAPVVIADAPDGRSNNTAHIIADLRIDNHDELTREFDLPQAASDDEVLAHAWGRWGFNIVDHLIGGFAFAVWDQQRQTLFLARDHAGERPLHFARLPGPDGGLAFASMPQALCVLSSIGRRINMARMAHHLAVLPLGNETFFEGIERLPPAHWMKVSCAGIEIRRYWHPIEARPIRYAKDADYVEEFCERFDRAVGARLEGSEGIASQLSGGLDSSSVSATAARLLARKNGRLTSFTAVPLPEYAGEALPGRFGDEGPMAAQVAALYPNIDHVRVHVAGRDPLACWRRDARLIGQPTFNPTNMLWIEAILEEMRSRGLGVMLHGATGNATISFGGLIGLSDLLRRGHWWRLFQLTRELRSGGYTSWRGAASWASGGIIPQWLRRLYHPEMRDFSFSFSAVRPEIASEYRLKEKALAEFYGADTSTASVRRDLYEFYDPGVSNAAVAAGWQIEQRDPAQDKRIFEFCFGIPVEQYLVGGQNRSLIRRAMQGRLPESTLRCTTRGLQSADWYLTLRAALPQLSAELSRIERSPLARHVLDTSRLRTLLDTFPSAGYDTHQVSNVWHLALTRGIAAGSFLADHDPDMVQDEYAAAATEKPGMVPGF